MSAGDLHDGARVLELPVTGTPAIWSQKEFYDIEKSIRASGLALEPPAPGAAPFVGTVNEVLRAYMEQLSTTLSFAERLEEVSTSGELDAATNARAKILQARLHYVLFARWHDSRPRLLEPRDRERLDEMDRSTDPGVLAGADHYRSALAQRWETQWTTELVGQSSIAVARAAEAYEYAKLTGQSDLAQEAETLLFQMRAEIDGVFLLVPEKAKETRAFLTKAEECGAWEPGSVGEFVPEALVRAPDDPAQSFTLKQASAGLAGSGPLVATLHTSLGELSCTLFSEQAPYTVANFVGLARGLRPFKDPTSGNWVTRPAYDRTIFHRIIKDFMAQGGDVTGTGAGEPGYLIPNEIWRGAIFNRRGQLAMANRGPNTNGMQFFITDAAAPHLNGGYTIFGQCDAGPVLDAIINVDVGRRDRPLEPPVIQSIEIAPERLCHP